MQHGLNCPVHLAAVSRWGNAAVISDFIGKNHREVSLRDGQVGRTYGQSQFWLDYHSLDVDKFVRPQAVRNRFSKIFVGPQGHLGLVSRRSESVISLAPNHQLVMESRRAGSSRQAGHRRVQSRPRAGGRRLFVAGGQMEGRQPGLARFPRPVAPEKFRSLDPRTDPRAPRRRPGGLDLRGADLRHGLFCRRNALGTPSDAYQTILQLPHVLAGRARFPQGSEADVYQNILSLLWPYCYDYASLAPVLWREAAAAAAAWLIPGAEPRIWLDEMLAWGVPLGDAVLYRIPRSARDLSPQGVLVVLPAGLVPRDHASQPAVCGGWSPREL